MINTTFGPDIAAKAVETIAIQPNNPLIRNRDFIFSSQFGSPSPGFRTIQVLAACGDAHLMLYEPTNFSTIMAMNPVSRNHIKM
jgi:hypothetical protein